MDLKAIENELKSRWKLPYVDDHLRIEIWQDQTSFVREIESFDELCDTIFQRFNAHKKFNDLKNYAINRWYHYHSEKAIRSLVENHKRVRLLHKSEGREQHFFIEGVPYQLRIFEFDKLFSQDVQTIASKRKIVSKGLLENSGIETSVIYLALASTNGKAAQLRSEIAWIKEQLKGYFDTFDKKEIARVNRGGHIAFTDLLILEK